MSASASGGATSTTPSSISSFCNRSVDDPPNLYAPLWQFVTVTAHREEGVRGNARWRCNFCGTEFSGSHGKIKHHLLQLPNGNISMCTKISTQQVVQLNRIVEDAAEALKPKKVPLPSSGTSSGSSIVGGRKRSGSASGGLEKAFNKECRDEVRAEIARMFYSGGVPFHLARNPHYVNSYKMAANLSVPGFIPPGYNALRTTLLERERANVERLLTPIRSVWRETGVSLCSDGWSDAQRRPLINFMAASEGPPVFLKCIDGSSEYKDKHYMAKLMIDTIKEIGVSKVVQVITDNAPVCKAAGALVEATYPTIFWTPCVVHTLNLALKNICAAKNTPRNEEVYDQCSWITNVWEDAHFIKNFIVNHSMRLAIFNTHAPLKLLSVAETRFASTIVMLKRFKLLKQGLKTMVVSDEWNLYREDDVEKAQIVRGKVLDDLWWDKIDYILKFTGPIYDMLRICDTDKPTLHLVYDMWDSMIEQVKSIIYRHEGLVASDSSPFFDVVFNVLEARWNKSSTPLHCLAHSLNPRFYCSEWLTAGPDRVPPHRDNEISVERNKCFRRFFPDDLERRAAVNEFAKFSDAQDEMRSFDCLQDRYDLEPKTWWLTYGSSLPRIQTLALKLLGQPCSSSCCERNWSTYSFIHSMKRNKILPKRAEDLVFVHSNLRLLSRKSDKYKKGPTRMWDIGGDAWDSFEGPGVLEVASLSLDEPDLEGVIFTEDGEGNDEIEVV